MVARTMVRSNRTSQLRENMREDVKQSKTLLSFLLARAPGQSKQITITGIKTATKEDELALKVEFRLLPSNTVFSKITFDLYFDEQKLNSICIRIPQGPLATDVLELTPVLDMKGISAGTHIIKAEMYELWSSGERLTHASKVVAVEYSPENKEERLTKVPIVKNIAGADLAIESDSEKDIYREIEEYTKKDMISKRDEW
jgi:hypothetical protein